MPGFDDLLSLSQQSPTQQPLAPPQAPPQAPAQQASPGFDGVLGLFQQQYPQASQAISSHWRASDWLAQRAEFEANNSVMDRQFSEGAAYRQERDWPAIAGEMRQRFPGINPEQYQDAYRAAHSAAFRQGHVQYLMQRYATAPLSEYRDYALEALPVVGTLGRIGGERGYREADQRIGQGQGTEADYDLVARFMAEQGRRRQRGQTTAGSLLEIAHGAMPFVAELMLTGGTAAAARQALTARLTATLGESAAATVAARTAGFAAHAATQAALSPSLTVSQAQQAAERNGGEWYHPGNLLQGQAAGTVQAAAFEATGYPGGLPAQGLGRHVLAPIAGNIAGDVALRATGLSPSWGAAGNLGSAQGLQHMAEEALVFGLIGAGTHGAERAGERLSRQAEPQRNIEPFRGQMPQVPPDLGMAGPSLEATPQGRAMSAQERQGLAQPASPAAQPVGAGRPPREGLVVAMLDARGRVYYGQPGENHGGLVERFGDFPGGREGFAGPDGRFLSREEALQVAERNQLVINRGYLREPGGFSSAFLRGSGSVSQPPPPGGTNVPTESLAPLPSGGREPPAQNLGTPPVAPGPPRTAPTPPAGPRPSEPPPPEPPGASTPVQSGVNAGPGAAGWKLHLATGQAEAVSKILRELGLTHKVGRSGQEGKDITVYVGSRDAAQRAAEAIQSRAGHLLLEPHGDTLKDDISLTPKVWGRFDAGKANPEFHQYGGQGIPWLAADMDIWNRRPGAQERADAALRAKFGEFYTGGQGPSAAPPAASPPVQSPLERMRDRQARQGVIPTPQPRPLKELPPVQGRPAPERLGQAMDAAGLTPIERHVLQETYKERTYDEIAHDPELGRVYTRAGVQAIDKRARGKLKEATGIELPSAHAQGVNVTDRAIDAAERGQQVNYTDLHADPETTRRAGLRLDDLQSIESRIDKLTEALEREVAAGTLTPEREAEYVREHSRLVQELEGRGQPAAAEPARGPARGQAEAGPPLPAPQGVHPEAAHEQGPAASPQGAGGGEGAVPLAAGAGGEPAEPNWYGRLADVPAATLQRLRGHVASGNRYARDQLHRLIREELGYQAADEALAHVGHVPGKRTAKSMPPELVSLPAEVVRELRGYVAKDEWPALKRNQLSDQYGRDVIQAAVDELRGQRGSPPEAHGAFTPYERQHNAQWRLEGERERLRQEIAGTPSPTRYTPEQIQKFRQDENFDPWAPEPERQAQEEQVQQAMTGRPRMIGGGQQTALRQVWEQAGRALAEKFQRVGDFFGELAGQTAPRTARLSEASADAVARHGAADTFTEHAAPYYTEMMLGRGAPPERDALWGAVFLEKMRLRYSKAQFQIEADRARRQAQGARTPEERQGLLDQAQEWEDKAQAVKTLVGADPGAHFREGGVELTEDLYQRTLRDPEFRSMLERWHDHFAPVQEDFFRKAEGLEADDPILSRTQTPGYPINAIPIKAEDLATTPDAMRAAGGRGNLRNVRLQTLVFTREFSGTADAYDVRLSRMIENTLRTSAGLATKAELYRQLVRDGLAAWGRENAYDTTVRGERAVRIPGVHPPPGTQEAQAGQTALWVHPQAEPEVRRVLAPDRPWGKLPGADLLTTVNLWSLAEATAHTKNLLTFLFKPGVSLVDLAKNAQAVWRNDPQAQKRMMELAQMGAARGRRMEATPDAGLLRRLAESPYNPTSWTGKFLDFVDRTMRLTADQAFDRLVGRGAENTERNRRDFLNQLGNYNKRTQSKLVAFLRDTGLGPFATAATNYTMQGLRALTMNPGVRTTSPQAQMRLRGEMLARTAALLAAGAIWNYLRWGRLDGDENTPLGAVKLGVGADGRTAYFDLAALTGITRGARTVGLLALLEGVRQGRSGGAIVDRAAHDVLAGAAHAAEGPAVQFAHTAATGENTLGIRIAERNGQSAFLNNLRAALMNTNPVLGAATASDQAQRVHPEPVPLGQRAMRLLGPYGVHYRGDQSLSVLGERLREVEAARQAYRNTRAWRSGRVFPREQEYQALSRAQQQVTTLNQELQGLVRTRRGLAPGAEANPQRQEQIRRQQAQIAQQALR